MKPVTVKLFCNDQHGSFEGCVRAIRFGDTLSLEAIAIDRPPRIAFMQFEAVTRLMRISGRVFPILSYRHCSPMAVADSVFVEPCVAAELLNFLKSKGTFTPDGGMSPIWEDFQSEGIRFSALGLEAACA